MDWVQDFAHIITTVEGGIITTDNSDFAEILRSLRNHGRACKCESCVLNTASAYCPKRFQYDENADIGFIFERIGFSCKMNELEEAIGIGNLDIYNDIIKRRRKTLYYLMDKFEKFKPYMVTIEKESYEQIGLYPFPIIIQEKASFTRNQLVNYLEKKD
ncbi:MAG: DegT/DnrJ/EryC1/StrS family aminotransferase [Candidatus Omnitrophota bacterium]|nr:DegT/DnrJ/EryC1/StrS family aminotransferase [Candidatus Omnitrophota bacterium]